MPKIDYIQGISIHVYSGEHRPPHLHAKYNEYEVLIQIDDGKLYAGSLPSKQLKLVLHWLALTKSGSALFFMNLILN